MPATPLTIHHYMSKAPVGTQPDTPLVEARQRMFELGVRHLPVVEGGRLVGVLSERDVALAESLAPVDERFPVARAMQTPTFTVGPDAHLHAVASEMAAKKIGTAVVVDLDHPSKVLGIFTTIDALRALADVTGHE